MSETQFLVKIMLDALLRDHNVVLLYTCCGFLWFLFSTAQLLLVISSASLVCIQVQCCVLCAHCVLCICRCV